MRNERSRRPEGEHCRIAVNAGVKRLRLVGACRDHGAIREARLCILEHEAICVAPRVTIATTRSGVQPRAGARSTAGARAGAGIGVNGRATGASVGAELLAILTHSLVPTSQLTDNGAMPLAMSVLHFRSWIMECYTSSRTPTPALPARSGVSLSCAYSELHAARQDQRSRHPAHPATDRMADSA